MYKQNGKLNLNNKTFTVKSHGEKTVYNIKVKQTTKRIKVYEDEGGGFVSSSPTYKRIPHTTIQILNDDGNVIGHYYNRVGNFY